MIIAYSAAAFMQYFPVNCIRHTYWSANIMFGLVFYVFILTINKLKKLTPFKVRFIMLLIIFTSVFGFVCTSLFSEIQIRSNEAQSRLRTFQYEFKKPLVLLGMKGTKTQVRNMIVLDSVLNRYRNRNYIIKSTFITREPYLYYSFLKNNLPNINSENF